MSEAESINGGKSAAAPKRRWRARFSLRTLLIFVLLVGSGALLWWDSAAFAPVFTIDETRQIVNAEFSPDDSEILTCTAEPIVTGPLVGDGPFASGAVYRFRYHVSIYDAKTALLKHRFDTIPEGVFDPFAPPYNYPPLSASFTGSGRYVIFWQMTSEGPDKSEFYDIETGAPTRFKPHDARMALSSRDGFAFLTDDQCYHLAKVPGKQHLREYDEIHKAAFSFDESLAIAMNDNTDQLQVIRTTDGSAVCQFTLDTPSDSDSYNIYASPTELIFAVGVIKDEKQSTQLFDLLSGKKIAEYPGRPAYHPFSPDGKRLLTIVPTGVPPPNPIGDWATPDKSKCGNVWDIGINRPPVVVDTDPMSFLTGEEIRGYPKGLYDAHTGQLLHEHRSLYYSPNGILAYDMPAPFRTSEIEFPESILRARTAKAVFKFSRKRWPKQTPAGEINLAFANRQNAFVTWNRMAREEGEAPAPDNGRVTVWRQMRPFEWYGMAWLPEFWAVALLFVGLLWSMWRDQKLT